MARSTNAPFKGRIQKRKTNHLQIITFGLQRTACHIRTCDHASAMGHSDELEPYSPAAGVFTLAREGANYSGPMHLDRQPAAILMR